jgi:D-lactate dehydrogenase (cytochrome)
MSTAPSGLATSDIGARLRAVLPADTVLDDDASRLFHANDIFWQPGIAPLAIARPGTREELAAAVRTATEAGIAVGRAAAPCPTPRATSRSTSAAW